MLGDNYGSACPDTGNQCHDLYAVSIAGVPPSRFITWFQAVAAARNAHKRLPTNQEWQAAAFGTPDPGTDNAATDCNVASPLVLVDTGSRSLCVSDVGLRDAVGNLWEWVADWTRHGNGGCSAELVAGTGDYNCQVGLGDGPAALARGGTGDLALAGVFAIIQRPPTESQEYIGFRAAR